ncbi:hypothetical protein D3C78_1943870 [compost metagenome]
MRKYYLGELEKLRNAMILKDSQLIEQGNLIANLQQNLRVTETNCLHLKIVCLVTTSIVIALTLLLLVTQF